jgi:phosphopantetheinyl transferase
VNARILVVEHIGVQAALDRLPPSERQHVLTFRSGSAAQRYANSRLALRYWLAGLLGVRPSEVQLHKTALGEPYIADCGWSISISHADSLSAIALSPCGSVGVDIERARPVDDAHAIAARYFHPAERQWLRDADASELSRRFLRLWVRKEAVAKAAGSGLGMALDDWSALAPDRAGHGGFRLVDGSNRSWWVQEVDLGPEHLLAVATLPVVTALTVEHRDFAWLLGVATASS